MVAPPVEGKRPGRRARDLSGYQNVVLVAQEGSCPDCQAELIICQHRARPLQTLAGRYLVTSKDRRCKNHETCPGGKVLYRPVQEGSLVLKGREYGADVVCFVGERYLRDSRSQPRLHQDLVEQGVLISPRHIGNLFRLFLALVQCRDGDDEAVRARLREQGRLVISVDAVKFDEVSPRLYVVRDVLSGEMLFSERIEFADAVALAALLKRVHAIGVPVVGVISDKEQALLTAVEEVFPGVPHQVCQVHYLQNLVRPMESDLAELKAGVKEVVGQVRDLERALVQDKCVSDQERGAAQALCTVVNAIGKSRGGDPLLDPPALRRFRRLTEAAETTTQALKTAGRLADATEKTTTQAPKAVGSRMEAAEPTVQAPKKAGRLTGGVKAMRRTGSQWPFMARLLAVLATLSTWAELARRLQLQFEVVHRIAHILHTQAPGSAVRRLLITYVGQLEKDADEGAPHGRWIYDYVSEVTARFWKGLFACYDHPDIPANNNALEGLFGAIKQQQRRVHGRKSTAGGPLDGCAGSLLEVWCRLDAYPDLLALVRDLPNEKLAEVRQEMERLAEPSRQRRSIARDPKAYLVLALARAIGKK